MNIRTIRKVGNGSIYVTLPNKWAKEGENVKIEIVNKNELKILKLDIKEKGNE